MTGISQAPASIMTLPKPSLLLGRQKISDTFIISSGLETFEI